jgi:hypothetical protein
LNQPPVNIWLQGGSPNFENELLKDSSHIFPFGKKLPGIEKFHFMTKPAKGVAPIQ